MSAFSQAFNQFFTMLSLLFSAASKLCGTADNLATVAEEASGQYKDQARIDRARNLQRIEHERAQEAKQLAIEA